MSVFDAENERPSRVVESLYLSIQGREKLDKITKPKSGHSDTPRRRGLYTTPTRLERVDHIPTDTPGERGSHITPTHLERGSHTPHRHT